MAILAKVRWPYILDSDPLSDEQLAKIVSHSMDCLSPLFFSCVVLLLFSFMEPTIYCWSHSLYFVLIRKSLPLPVSGTAPAFSSGSLRVTGLMLRFLIQMGLSFVQRESQGSHFTDLHAEIQFSMHWLLKTPFFLHCVFSASLSKSDNCSCVPHIWVLNHNSLIHVSA